MSCKEQDCCGGFVRGVLRWVQHGRIRKTKKQIGARATRNKLKTSKEKPVM
jgi:hypothetical protein